MLLQIQEKFYSEKFIWQPWNTKKYTEEIVRGWKYINITGG